MKPFDRKFGKEFLKTVPKLPGVYRAIDEKGQLIYIGKAKNLRNRLIQYRNAKRLKKHRKMKRIISEASSFQYQVCESELEASLLETKLIQTLRPKWNIASAFSFLYPYLGIRMEGQVALFCYTTQPESFSDFQLHGAFRSRKMTREAFYALMNLLKFTAHKHKTRQPQRRFSKVLAFRNLPQGISGSFEKFMRGDSRDLMEMLIFELLENAFARAQGGFIQENLDILRKFWKKEALSLRLVRLHSGFCLYPVPQRERDPLFLKYRAATVKGK